MRSGSWSARLQALLESRDFEEKLSDSVQFPAGKLISPLMGFLCRCDETLKWRAVRATGLVVARIAETNLEAARVVMRRFIWNLNDECGGIGWGLPEAMGETMALSERLAEEYHLILRSYISEEGNLLGNPLLERGVLWGLGRLAQVRPHLVRDSSEDIAAYLESSDPIHRGFAAWALGFLGPGAALSRLSALLDDQCEIHVFDQGSMAPYRLCDLARKVLERY